MPYFPLNFVYTLEIYSLIKATRYSLLLPKKYNYIIVANDTSNDITKFVMKKEKNIVMVTVL